MRDLQKIATECLKELDAIGIKYGKIVEFKVNTRAKKRWGQCKTISGGFSINISYVLLDENNSIDGLKNTIIHEILHTCKGCLNHGEMWKRQAAKVNKAYGYNIKRCSSADEKGVEVDDRKTEPKKIKHSFRCKTCGTVVNRTRESKFTKHYTHYRCGKCGGCFEKLF